MTLEIVAVHAHGKGYKTKEWEGMFTNEKSSNLQTTVKYGGDIFVLQSNDLRNLQTLRQQRTPFYARLSWEKSETNSFSWDEIETLRHTFVTCIITSCEMFLHLQQIV